MAVAGVQPGEAVIDAGELGRPIVELLFPY